MFESVIELIEKEEYASAEKCLQEYIKFGDHKTQAYANYLIGYINSCWQNKERSKEKAHRYLLYNLNSEYPHCNAYALFARLEEDKNIVEKYLNIGLEKYPNHPQLMYELINHSQDRISVIARILESGSTDITLLSRVVEVLIENQEWDKLSRVIFRIQSNNTLDNQQVAYLNLLSGFSGLFEKQPDYLQAIKLFESAEERDLNNFFGYAHYLGLIYAHMKSNSHDAAIKYFDRLPTNNSIFDLMDGPWHFITVDFYNVYQDIFALLECEFENDLLRLNKARCLYALYLYYPSEIYGTYRYGEKHINMLRAYFDASEYNKHIAVALIHMYCHVQKYIEANVVFLSTAENGDDVEPSDCYYGDIIHNADAETLQIIVNQTVEFVKNSDAFDYDIFRNNALDSLIAQLQENRLYTNIVAIAELYSIDMLCVCENAFYIAYAYSEIQSPKGMELYKKIFEKEPGNSCVMNNIGVILEQNGNFAEALSFFERAAEISKESKHINNAQRIKVKIQEGVKQERAKKRKEYRAIVKNVNLEYFEQLGYNEHLLSKFSSVQGLEVRQILLRDMQECAVAIATGQTKNATIMTGSIIEALLYAKLTEKSITSYAVPTRSGTINKVLQDMALADLLFVAEQEKLITPNSIQLSHYVRDYRNFIHPAKEIRSTDHISQENVLIMWSILKRLIDELL